MPKLRTHYQNLKVSRDAPDSFIKAAYKALCQTYHPDKFQGSKEEADRIMKIVNASYEVLIDPVKRARHDQFIDEQEAKTKQKDDKLQFHDIDKSTTQQHQESQNNQSNQKSEEPPESTNSHPNNAQLNTNSDVQIAPLATGWGRFFARMFDMWWETMLVCFVLAFVLSRYSTDFVDWFDNTANASTSFGLLCVPVALVLDAMLYHLFGNTPGKAWLGIRVRTVADSPLDFFQYLGRNFKFYVSGLAFGLPIIGLFTMGNQAIRLRKGLQVSYDESTGFRVFAQVSNWVSITSFGLAFACLFMVLALLNSIEKFSKPESMPSANQNMSVENRYNE